MKKIIKPQFDEREIFELCLSGISDAELVARLSAASHQIYTAGAGYLIKADSMQLFTIPENNQSNTSFVFAGVTKSDLKSLYSSYMVPAGKPARSIYNLLKNLSELCPFCDAGFVKNLDHYLPKAKYPQFSVLTANLVPVCRDCNTEKNDANALRADQQTLHPYFIAPKFTQRQWLFARVSERNNISFEFYVSPPAEWGADEKGCVRTHFSEYKLSRKYTILAAQHYSSIRPLFRLQKSADAVLELLQGLERNEADLQVNSWRRAMAQALLRSDWFCREGYLI